MSSLLDLLAVVAVVAALAFLLRRPRRPCSSCAPTRNGAETKVTLERLRASAHRVSRGR